MPPRWRRFSHASATNGAPAERPPRRRSAYRRPGIALAAAIGLAALAALAALALGILLLLPSAPIAARLARLAPGCVYTLPTPVPAVALTIDDGPDSRTTPALLDVLARHGARATFFMIGERVDGREPLVRRVVAEGHELGNHTMRDEPSVELAPAAFDTALARTGRILEAFDTVRWARPGAGRYDEPMLRTMRRQGYRCAAGSVYPLDAHLPSAAFAAWYVLRNVEDGAVIVLHDAGGRGRRTAAALGRVLPELARRGCRVVTLTELEALRRAPATRPAARAGSCSGR